MCRTDFNLSLSILPSDLRVFVQAIFVFALLGAASCGFANAGKNPPLKASVAASGSGRCDEAEMDRLYNRILYLYRNDPVFIAKFKSAQAAWLQFREAHLAALYPAEDKLQEYGSAFGKCFQMAAGALTCTRISQLRRWVDGVPEGETCAGSLRMH